MRPRISITFSIHYSLINLSFDATYAEPPPASSNRQENKIHSIRVQIQIHLFFLVSRLWVRRGFGRVHIPILLHKGVFGLVVLKLWTREVVLLTLPSCDTKVQTDILSLLRCRLFKVNCKAKLFIVLYSAYRCVIIG
jgi:hypothetical protein